MATTSPITTGTMEGDIAAGLIQGGTYTGGTTGGTTNLYKVATGSTGADGKPVYDVFNGDQHISDPNDPLLKGVDITSLKDGMAPSGYKSEFLPINTDTNSGIVSDTSEHNAAIDNMSKDITDGLASFGITPPPSAIDATVQQMIDDAKARQAQLAADEKTDTANIEKSSQNTKDQLAITQADELAKAEGRTRIGGFFTQMEANDILKLQRQQSLDMAALDGQKQAALLAAHRAYQEQNYKLAQDQLTLAKSIEDDKYKKQQDYFNNVIQYNSMSTPLSRANEAIQKTVTDWITKYPDAFKNIKPSDLLNMSLKEAYSRVIDSPSYQAAQRKQAASDITYNIEEINGHKIRYGFDATGKVVSRVDLGLATKTSSTGNTTAETKTAASKIGTYLTSKAGTDHYVSPDDYRIARNSWVSDGYSSTDFDTRFSGFVNPYHAADYGIKWKPAGSTTDIPAGWSTQ